MTNNYRRGVQIEFKAKYELEKEGFSVQRAAGSHSQWDLNATRKDKVLYVQCKSTLNKKPVYNKELKLLKEWYLKFVQESSFVEVQFWIWLRRIKNFRKAQWIKIKIE